jgi:cyclophilin family peptidyl-prolyl cis-trans isomerase
MKKYLKYLPIVVTAVVIVAIVATVIYYRVRSYETCDTVLGRYGDNHLCIATNHGVMVFELFPDAAPKSVNHIKMLANDKKFYDGLEFYRVVKDFVVQAGIQDYIVQKGGANLEETSMQSKLDLYYNEKIDVEVNFDKLELTEDEKKYLSQIGVRTNPNLNTRAFEYGSLAFANKGDSDPNSNSTEIFIVTGKDSNSDQIKSLNGKFTNLGRLVEGSDVLESLNKVEINKNYIYSTEQSKPLNTIRIFEVRAK